MNLKWNILSFGRWLSKYKNFGTSTKFNPLKPHTKIYENSNYYPSFNFNLTYFFFNHKEFL